jgi:MFS family permease
LTLWQRRTNQLQALPTCVRITIMDRFEKTPERAEVEKSLKLSLYDGAFAGIMTGLTQEYFTPFILVLGATVRQVGMLTALPNLLGALLQIKSAEVTERLGSRKRTMNAFVLLQALTLIPMAAAAVTGVGGVYGFIGLVMLFTAFGAFATPAWGSLMSDLVDEERRGDYFGLRTMLLGVVSIISMFFAGLTIHYAKIFSVYIGFALIFFLAFVFRMLSWSLLKRMYEPPFRRVGEEGYTFRSFLASIRGDNFGKFVIAVSMMNFSVNLAGPFFAVLMLRDLHLSYLTYTVITVTASVAIFATIRRWGRHADRVGNIKVIKTTSYLVSIIPLLWLVSLHPLFLVAAQVYSGFLWAGFNLGAANFIYDAVPSHERVRSIAYFNVINGIALFAGALTGGFLLKILPPLTGNTILTLLCVSSALRLLVSCFLIARLKEVRPVAGIRSSELFFSIIGLRPLIGIERKTLRY